MICTSTRLLSRRTATPRSIDCFILGSVGVLEELAGQHFKLTPLGEARGPTRRASAPLGLAMLAGSTFGNRGEPSCIALTPQSCRLVIFMSRIHGNGVQSDATRPRYSTPQWASFPALQRKHWKAAIVIIASAQCRRLRRWCVSHHSAMARLRVSQCAVGRSGTATRTP
jgi:hypothetical protein